MAKVENGWFAEISDLWYGQAMSFEVNKVLCHKKSQYQDILMFERLVLCISEPLSWRQRKGPRLAILSDPLFEKVLINIQEETERNTITVYVIIENVNFCSGMLKIQ